MGWSGGSELMEKLIKAQHKLLLSNIEVRDRIAFWTTMIEAFSDHDCDTMRDCMGVDGDFDAAFVAIYGPGDEDEK